MSSVVLITAFDGRDSVLSRGTGFFLSPNRLLTNMHVIKDACKAEATTASGKILSIAFVLSDSKNSDLVEVEVEGTVEHQTMLPLSDHLPDEGERVVVLGNPLGLQGTVTDGIISSIRAVEPFGSVIQMTAPVHARGILPTQAI